MCRQGAPYLIVRNNDSSLSGNDQYEGYCFDLAKMIAEHVGFSYEIRPVLDGAYGARDIITGKWNGIVGELVRKVCRQLTSLFLPVSFRTDFKDLETVLN